ncbi:MAG: MerR family transcriptional regulator [Patulibacter sp.]|nr:MerR family transcriptional regulator [Patulibacter sp.]
MIPIGPFARLTRLSVKQLRSYDALGLLAPARVDDGSGYRYYHPAQARTAITIGLLRSLDVPLETIRELLVADDEAADRLLATHRTRLAAELARTERTIRALRHLRSDLELMPHRVREGVDPPRRLLAIRGTSSAERLADDAAAEISRLLATLPPSTSAETPVIGLYPLDLDDDVTFSVGVEVSAVTDAWVAEVDPSSDGIRPVDNALVDVEIPGGPVARAVHVGPHDELPLAWFPLLAWARERGHEVVGPVRERYVDDPATTEPHLLRTEISIRFETSGDPA